MNQIHDIVFAKITFVLLPVMLICDFPVHFQVESKEAILVVSVMDLCWMLIR